jgi:hypothetical protein
VTRAGQVRAGKRETVKPIGMYRGLGLTDRISIGTPITIGTKYYSFAS